ncbi:MAG: hypothetical protein KDC98_01165 [Planctomycetes bacterium]|nr:hypothetical protein [Planctomycetota bacterium]
MASRDRLLRRIGDINDFSRPRPLVTLDEFFEGNRDPGSIGYNLPDPPDPQEFRGFLTSISERDVVSAVLIEVTDLEDPDGWPSSDTAWVITSAMIDEVASWVPERFRPDEYLDGFPESGVEPHEVRAGFRAVGLWYD